ncbi:hypothetical protein [Methanocrinis sp.]|uniref:hypothetical protein n=1 Tax=Methanocrinis sp. TaxID=3101522 RepID=UPI003D148BC8
MTIFDSLFEALMTAAERVDQLRQKSGTKAALLALLATAILIYVLAPGPYDPEMPCPMDNTSSIGLEPPLWWVGGGPSTPLLSSMGLDPNSRISYEVALGTSDEDMQVVGTARGGRRKENLHINITRPLDPGTVYLWRVAAENGFKKRAESEVWTFSTRSLPVIEHFEADRTAMDLGETLNLSWSVANAGEVEIEPGVGEVSTWGEVTLAPSNDVNYTLTARNFAGMARAAVEVAILQPRVIDSMAGGWSSLEDGRGSIVQDIRTVTGVEDDATRISYDLVPDGWVGITRTVRGRGGNGSLNLAGTDGISFFLRGSESANTLQVWVGDANGTVYGRPWERGAIAPDWARQEALYEEFGCIEAEGSGCIDATLDLRNVTAFYFIVRDPEGGALGSSGWIAVDDLEALRLKDGGAEGRP